MVLVGGLVEVVVVRVQVDSSGWMGWGRVPYCDGLVRPVWEREEGE